ncbi:5'-nucleotidase [Massilia litorea]|uniref:5'-nucleotidase n=1 Tax=Massilia litorea TaxID=2769491 RepID=A0A7L9U4L4_9BURK|nr:5'-nucleotidase [Massilia litorea]QOL49065.1 5'-nucleotidase [Massilia litorea]
MPFPIEHKLVIGVASSALFDLSESHQVYLDKGPEEYRLYQEAHLDAILGKGVAFPFIRRFLNINACFPDESPVEVVLFSRNSPETGLRVMRSIAHYGLDISRAAFMAGKSPYSYLPAFNASLFLSANEEDVRSAIAVNYPAGLVLPSQIDDGEEDLELRVAFDFDGVLADDESEAVFKRDGLDRFHAHETLHMERPHSPGPLANMFQKLAMMQRLEERAQRRDAGYRRIVRIAIITARSAPSHERVVTTLKSWGVSADETFFLGGMDKARVLEVFRPHIFFDDQLTHLRATPGGTIPMVHVPFGVANRAAAPGPESSVA